MKSLQNNLYWALVVVVLSGEMGQASGAPLTFYFDGEVRFVHDSLNLDESVYVGGPFSGSYTFDPASASDSYPNDPSVGFYGFPAGRMSTRIGNYDFLTPNLGVLIWNNLAAGDLYQAGTTSPFQAAGTQWSGMFVVLGDLAGNALANDALPLGVPDLSDFPSFAGLVLHLPGDSVGIQGRLTSLTPEPGSLALLAVGATVLGVRRRR